MNKAFFSLAALAVFFAASAAQAGTVNFDSGSAKVHSVQVTKHKKPHKHKVWAPAHRSHGHWVKGHYVWR